MSFARRSAVGSVSLVGRFSVDSLPAVTVPRGRPAICSIRLTTGEVVMSCESTWARAVSGSNSRFRSATDERGKSTRILVSAVPLSTDRWVRPSGDTENR